MRLSDANMFSLTQAFSGSDNGLSPRRQAIIWTKDMVLLMKSLTGFNDILIKIVFNQENAFENIVCKMSVIFFRPQCIYMGSLLLTFPMEQQTLIK